MGYVLYPIFFYLRGIIRNKKMATTLHFNITTKKVKVDQTVSQDLYGIITGPSGVAFVTKNAIGNELIDGSTQSIYFNLPLDTSNNIVFGTYTIKYGTSVIDPNNSATYTVESFTYLGADVLTACFTVEHNCDYYPTGLISATDSTYYGNNAGTASSPEILSRSIYLYYPDGLVNPTPAVNPAEGIQSPITTGNYTLTVDTLATGMWTAIMDVQLLYQQDDDLVIEYQLKKTLNHNVACVGQLCSINKCIDGMTQAFNSDVACGVTTPRYAKQLTLINSYFSQYQMERACGNTAKANEYLNLMNELVGGESSCGCSGSGSCSGSCGSSCSCDSCGDDNTPRWINTPGSTTQSILEQIQGDINTLQDEIDNLSNGIDSSNSSRWTLGAIQSGLNPGTNNFDIDSGTPSSVTEIYVNRINSSNIDVQAWIVAVVSLYNGGDRPTVIQITKVSNPAIQGVYQFSSYGSFSGGTWFRFGLTFLSGSGTFLPGDEFNISFLSNGADGPTGSEGPAGPEGVQGPAGSPGPVGPAGLNWQGAWVSGTSYVEDDAVGYGGASWFCILATSGTTAPDLATSNWALLASQGAIGPQGVQGPMGPQGPPGSVSSITLTTNDVGGPADFTGEVLNIPIYQAQITHLEYGNITKTIWNNGKGDVTSNTSFGDDALRSNTTGSETTAIGYSALSSNTTGNNNTAVGTASLQSNITGGNNTAVGRNALQLNTTGSVNTAIGVNALASNTTGTNNSAVGTGSLRNNTTGSLNTAIGTSALFANTTGGTNTAIGTSALASNTTGGSNVAIGSNALQFNTTGGSNTAIGVTTLQSNTTGVNNIGIGVNALYVNTIGSNNTAIGVSSLFSNTTANSNTAIGSYTLQNNTTGNNNVGIGSSTLQLNTTGGSNTAIGTYNLLNNTTGSLNTAIGYSALYTNTTGGSNTAIGTSALASNTTGGSNTAIGLGSLQNNTTGINNVAIGANSIQLNTTGSGNTAIGVNTISGNFSNSVILGYGATATNNNQFVVGSSLYNAGTVSTETNISTKVWNVIINGVAQKILLA